MASMLRDCYAMRVGPRSEGGQFSVDGSHQRQLAARLRDMVHGQFWMSGISDDNVKRRCPHAHGPWTTCAMDGGRRAEEREQ